MAFQEILREGVAVDLREVWRHLGGRGQGRVSLSLPSSSHRTVEALLRVVTPREVADRWLARRLRSAEKAVFVLAAARIDRSLDPFQRHVEHAVTCAALRRFAARLEGRLRLAVAPDGLSRRWSPGTLGWELASGQREVFARLEAAALGVRLHDTGCMEPSHAWSMVWGVGRFDRVSVSECEGCGDRGCPTRAEGAA